MRMSAYLLLCAVTGCAGAQEPFPANNAPYFTSGGDFDAKYDKKLVALEGQIVRVEKGPKDKPLFQLALREPLSRSVWIGSLVADSKGALQLGHTIRVLGYLQEIQLDDTWSKAVTEDKRQILGFCFVDANTKKGVFLPSGIKQCEAWQAGRKPEELAR